jgi:hypothetical protein
MILDSLWIDYNEVVALRGIKNKKPGLFGKIRKKCLENLTAI